MDLFITPGNVIILADMKLRDIVLQLIMILKLFRQQSIFGSF